MGPIPGGYMGAMATGARTGDVVVVGAPRSGTSLVAQLLRGAGLHPGDHLLPPTEANPPGFVEDIEVSRLNDELLADAAVGTHAGGVPSRRFAWLAVLAADRAVRARCDQSALMATLLPRAPAVIKDPRFAYTLDAWRPALRPGTSFVAVVRDPAEVAVSLTAMVGRDPAYYGSFAVTLDRALALWEAVNRRLLDLMENGPWVVVDHSSLLTGRACATLGAAIARPVDVGVVDPSLHRSRPGVPVPPALAELHQRLRRRAEDDERRFSDG